MSRTALITGASKGLGKTIATLLARQGFDLILTARGAQELDRTAAKLRQYTHNVIAISGNVADLQHRTRLAREVENIGRLDLLINNASTLGPTPLPELVEFPVEKFVQLFAVNVFAPVALVQETLPFLKTAGGLVVNISSDAAVGGYENWGGYGASKAALDLISRTMANELKDSSINVVSVDPGDMQTDLHQVAFPGEDISDRALPDDTLPFWGWLFGQEPSTISGTRFQAQSDHWELANITGQAL